MATTVLFLSANPVGTKPIKIADEEREIQDALRRSNAKMFDFKTAPALRINDIWEGIVIHRPAILHFSAHGEQTDEFSPQLSRDLPPDQIVAGAKPTESQAGILLVCDENGRATPLSPEALRNILANVQSKYPIRCVVLNACFTAAHAELIADHVDFVVGTTGRIQDNAAIAFSKAFYFALGGGLSFMESFALSQQAISDISGCSPAIVRYWAKRTSADALGLLGQSLTTDAAIQHYLEWLSQHLNEANTISRGVNSSLHGPINIGVDSSDTLELSDGDVVFLDGWSGRGKTSALRVLARRTLHGASPSRVPLFIRAESVVSTVPRAVLDRLAQTASPFQSEAELLQWMSIHPTLLLIDDWHHATDAGRRLIVDFISMMRPAMMAIVIASAPDVPAPAASRLHRISLGRYSIEERDSIITQYLQTSSSGLSQSLLENLPPGLDQILLEPAFLDAYLQLVRRSRYGTATPANAPELLNKLLEHRLTSMNTKPQTRLRELRRICMAIANEPRRIRLDDIADAAKSVGISEGASSLATELVACGVLIEEASHFEFEHEIWRQHFKAMSHEAAGAWDSPESVRAWVAALDRSQLFMQLPFAAGLIRGIEEQEAFFDAVLEKDLELYLRALPMRGSIRPKGGADTWVHHCLRGLYRGYVDLVDYHFHVFKSAIDPWCFGNEDDNKAILIGQISQRNISYSFEHGNPEDPDIIIPRTETFPELTPDELDQLPNHTDDAHESIETPILGFTYTNGGRVVRGLDFARSLKRPGSTRLIAAQMLLRNIEDALNEHRLFEAPWIIREEFGSLFIEVDRQGRFDAWMRKTVEEVTHMASAMVETQPRLQADNEPSFTADTTEYELIRFAALGRWLIDLGYGNYSMDEIVLPGPELIDHTLHFSEERRTEYVRALFVAVAETYKFVCENMSVDARSHLFFAQWPCRAVVDVEMGEDGNCLGWMMHWEVCDSWNTDPIVNVVNGASQMLLSGQWEALTGLAKQRCRSLGRKFVDIRAHSTTGKWSPWAKPATEIVCDLLMNDIQVLKKWFQHGT